MKPKYDKIEVNLIGKNGNAYNILAVVITELRYGLRKYYDMQYIEINKVIEEFKAEAMQISYNHLLQTVMRYVNVC